MTAQEKTIVYRAGWDYIDAAHRREYKFKSQAIEVCGKDWVTFEDDGEFHKVVWPYTGEKIRNDAPFPEGLGKS